MLAGRWQDIEKLYHSACGLPPETRRAWLERVCEDDSLRREVESLLDNGDLAKSFLESAEPRAEPPDPGGSIPPGARIGPYEVIEFLQAGGMGEVYKAQDVRLGRPVAIKFLPPEFSADPAALERFEREARAASALNHPGICTVYDAGDYGGRPFIVMEFLEGQSLRERIAGGALPVSELTRFAVQICEALQAAHAKGIVHRDIKPANIFVVRAGSGRPPRIKILDFGLAKSGVEPRAATAADGGTVGSDASLTPPGGIFGTLAYLSPEQARGEDVDARSDIYSCGVVMYQMATGVTPFQGKAPGELIDAILRDAPLKPSGRNSSVPARLERIVLRAMEKDRSARYQRAGELLADLEAFERSAASAPRTRRWLLASSGAAAGLLGGGALLARLGVFAPARQMKVAVLPLENLAGDPKQDYFADGVHEDLISSLGRLYPGSLAVIASASVKNLREANRKLDQIGNDLKVEYVVEGGARKDGQRVHVAARLTRLKDRTQIWSASYDRDLRDISALESEIAQTVARRIETSLRPVAGTSAVLAHPLNPDAYELFLRGEYRKSIQADPGYAPAHAGLAGRTYYAALFGALPPIEGFTNVVNEAAKAIELDPTLASAHGYLALGKLHLHWRWQEAEESFRRALRLNPSDAEVRHNFAHFLLWMNRGKESAAECDRAVELNPFDPGLIACLGWHDLWAGDYDAAIDTTRRALTFQPDDGWALMIMGWAYEQKGMFREASSALQKSFAGSLRKSAIAHVFALSGNRAAAEQLLQELMDDSRKKYVPAYDIAVVYAGLASIPSAFEWLEKAYQEHSGFMPYINLDPRFRPLRSDPRFRDLLSRMGLPNQKAV